MSPLSRIAVVAFLLLLLPHEVMAGKGNQITVGPSGDFATIQEAVDASNDGTLIRVAEGIYNESVVISGKRDLTLSGAKHNAIVLGTTSHAFEINAGGGLTTLVTFDDTQDRPVGQGFPDVVCVQPGAGGICESLADPNDIQTIPVGQGIPDATCVSTGMDGVLDTANALNDDVLEALDGRITTGPDGVCDTSADPADDQVILVGEGQSNGVCVRAGADGICETMADPNDEQSLPVGQSLPNQRCVGIGPNLILQTTPAGDDMETMDLFGFPFVGTGADGVCDTIAMSGDDVVGPNLEMIDSGADGICQTSAGMGETQVIPVGNGEPDSICVSAGFDGILDTAVPAGDDVVDVPSNSVTSGPDGICETTADPADFQRLPIGQGQPESTCVTSDEPLTRSRNVKIEKFDVRAPNGFDGIHVERSDFVRLTNITADGTLELDVPDPSNPCGPATGRHGIFVDSNAVKPTIKSSTALCMRFSGFFIAGPGAQVQGCTAVANGQAGFAQTDRSESANYVSNVALLNPIGFGSAGHVNIFQRCTASENGLGFDIRGVGNIIFQSVANSNGTGVESIGRGTRIRESVIANNDGVGIRLLDTDEERLDAQGAEIFGNTIQGNVFGGIEIDVFGVVIRNNTIGAKKPTAAASQNVGIFLSSDSGGSLVEDNKILNNVDEAGNICSPAGTLCDLVDLGLDNAGRNNQFTKGFMVPEGFE